ncbi:hypothetical protein I7331_30940 [Frankia sp. AgB1.8]|nr:hypothetical protein [Frankia sp. AgB1.8]
MSHVLAAEALTAALAHRLHTLEPNAVLVGLALHDGDAVFVERWCRRIARESADLRLVATASLCLGHVARRFGDLEPASVALVRQLAERPDLDSRVLTALDDVTFFIADPPDSRGPRQGS